MCIRDRENWQHRVVKTYGSMGATMDLRLVFSRTTSWAAAATAAAMCVSAPSAQAIVGQGAAAAPHAAVVAATGGFSASKWGNPAADAVSKSSDGTYQAAQDPGSLFT